MPFIEIACLNNVIVDLHKYEKLFQQLKAGEFKSAGLEKLKGHPNLYSVRANHKDRLLLAFMDRAGRRILVVVEEILDHRYKDSRYLNNPKVSVDLEALDFERVDQDSDANLSGEGVSTEAAVTDDYETVYSYDNQFLYFNAEQNRALKSDLPAVICGDPGSGKSVIALTILIDFYRQSCSNANTKPIAYVASDDNMVQWMLKLYRQHPQYDPASESIVLFLTYAQMVKRLPSFPEGYGLAGRTDFARWFSDWLTSDSRKNTARGRSGKCLDLLSEAASRQVYQEIRLLAGCADNAAYLKLGARQSSLREHKAREVIIDIYKYYASYLKKMKQIDTALYRVNERGIYYKIVSDESQQRALLELEGLIQLTESNSIVCCLDTRQMLIDAVSPMDFLIQRLQCKPISLLVSYRCPVKIIDLANRVLTLGRSLTGGVTDKYQQPDIKKADGAKQGEVNWLSDSPAEALRLNELLQQSVFAVLTKDKTEARKRYDTPFIFTTEEAIGLEFDELILDRPLSDPGFVRAEKLIDWSSIKQNIHRAKQGEGDSSFLSLFNDFFVKVTRCRSRVWIVQDKKHEIARLYDWLGAGMPQSPTAQSELVIEKTQTQLFIDRKAMYEQLLANGNEEQAREAERLYGFAKPAEAIHIEVVQPPALEIPGRANSSPESAPSPIASTRRSKLQKRVPAVTTKAETKITAPVQRSLLTKDFLLKTVQNMTELPNYLLEKPATAFTNLSVTLELEVMLSALNSSPKIFAQNFKYIVFWLSMSPALPTFQILFRFLNNPHRKVAKLVSKLPERFLWDEIKCGEYQATRIVDFLSSNIVGCLIMYDLSLVAPHLFRKAKITDLCAEIDKDNFKTNIILELCYRINDRRSQLNSAYKDVDAILIGEVKTSALVQLLDFILFRTEQLKDPELWELLTLEVNNSYQVNSLLSFFALCDHPEPKTTRQAHSLVYESGDIFAKLISERYGVFATAEPESFKHLHAAMLWRTVMVDKTYTTLFTLFSMTPRLIDVLCAQSVKNPDILRGVTWDRLLGKTTVGTVNDFHSPILYLCVRTNGIQLLNCIFEANPHLLTEKLTTQNARLLATSNQRAPNSSCIYWMFFFSSGQKWLSDILRHNHELIDLLTPAFLFEFYISPFNAAIQGFVVDPGAPCHAPVEVLLTSGAGILQTIYERKPQLLAQLSAENIRASLLVREKHSLTFLGAFLQANPALCAQLTYDTVFMPAQSRLQQLEAGVIRAFVSCIRDANPRLAVDLELGLGLSRLKPPFFNSQLSPPAPSDDTADQNSEGNTPSGSYCIVS